MKKRLLLFLCFLFISAHHKVHAQDSITIRDLQQFAYSFSLENGNLTGEGAQILTKAISESHITMLAENVGSKLERNFTNALIDELDKYDYKNIVLETGGASAALLNKMIKNGELTTAHIKAFNHKYALDKNGRLFPPIPELKSQEALQFVQNATNRGWNFLGLGIEPWTSYKMFADELFSNLNAKDQKANRELYEETIAFLNEQYKLVKAHNPDEVYKIMSQIRTSESFTDFLEKMNTNKINSKIVNEIRASINYYWMYGNKKMYEKNMWSAKEDKLKLTADLKAIQFDFKKDKLFVKMWRNHLSKGHAIFGAYGVGNMLHEFAEGNGNTSLVIGVVRRFYKKDGEVKDLLNSSDVFTKRYYEVAQLGKENEWTLVDLRPFIKKFYYGSYDISNSLYKMFARYDMIIIPKVDEEATANY